MQMPNEASEDSRCCLGIREQICLPKEDRDENPTHLVQCQAISCKRGGSGQKACNAALTTLCMNIV